LEGETGVQDFWKGCGWGGRYEKLLMAHALLNNSKRRDFTCQKQDFFGEGGGVMGEWFSELFLGFSVVASSSLCAFLLRNS
jgi:hypothetical protein